MLPIRSAEGSGAKDDTAEDAEYDDTLQYFTVLYPTKLTEGGHR